MKYLPQILLALAAMLAITASALADVHYVDVNNTNATPPYTNWATAATNIQDAVDAAMAGEEIVVTGGIYSPVVVSKPLSLRSVNGPQLTVINGGGARCVYLTNNASLSGFTLTNGYAGGGYLGGPDPHGGLGGGLYCESSHAVASNCVISGNSVYSLAYVLRVSKDLEFLFEIPGLGAGVWGGTLHQCILSGNGASGWQGFVTYYEQERYVIVSGEGGGAYNSTLNNCILTGNSADYGGGAYNCTLNNCTLTGNSATNAGGGAWSSVLNNCIVYFNGVNTPGSEDNYGGGFSTTLNYCCTTPQPTNGVGNITNAPLFVDTNGWTNLRLQSNSPCINAGNNACIVGNTDLDGNPRIVGGMVDIGAYEYQSPVSQISYAWLQQFGMPINNSTDTADPDGDAVDNYHEWLAGTDPTNPFSSPAQLTITPSGLPPSAIILTWSTNAVGFTLQSTTNLLSPAAWVTNSAASAIVNGQNTVTNPITGAQKFYRLISD